MRRRRLGVLASAAIVIAAVAVAAGCSTTPPPAATHNLERPSDIAFACVGVLTVPAGDAGADGGADVDGGGGAGTPQISGRPMSECHPPLKADPLPDITRRTFGFVANSARGELSVIDMDSSKLVDLDPFNPGTNVAPLGVLPEQLATSDDGCRIVSANRGSCDLTLVDIGTLMSQTLAAESKLPLASTGSSTISQAVVVHGSSGKPLRLSPQEVMFLPQDTSAIKSTQNLCTRRRPFADPVGWNATPSQPNETQWKALVTYPTCNLVALVDLPSGAIVDSVKVMPSDDLKSVVLRPAGSDPDCPVQDFCDGRPALEEGGGDAGAPAADAGDASPGTGATAGGGDPFVNPNGTSPGPMAILPGGGRVYVGLGQAAFVVAIDVNPNQLAVPPSGGAIPLHEGALGVDRVRLSVDPYQATGTPGQFGRFVGEGVDHFFGEGFDRQRQYLYAIARDGTVRVVDVSPGVRLQSEFECDTSLDPQFFPVQPKDPNIPERAKIFCWPAAPPDVAHRRPFTRGPGIRLPGIPRDVAFADLTLGSTLEGVLDGSFGFILMSSGAAYIVNIDPTLRTTWTTATSGQLVTEPSPLPEELPMVSSIRDQNIVTFVAGQDPTIGPPRLDLPPTVAVQGPQIQMVSSNSVRDNPTNISTSVPPAAIPTYVFFPQRGAAQRQSWSVVWQGDLVGPSISGQFKAGDDSSPATMTDIGVDFCQAGVLAGDFVTIYGCTVDQQCGPLQVCRRSPTAPETAGALPINGLCLPLDPTLQEGKLSECASLLETVRRYEITEAKAPVGLRTVLSLRPKIDEISSVTSRCAGKALGDPCGPDSDPTRMPFACAVIDGDTTNLRCVQPCSIDVECRLGRRCVDDHRLVPDPVFKGKTRLCSDGPSLIPTSDPPSDLVTGCGLDQLVIYKIGVGNGFLVQGTAPTPFVPGRVNAARSCIRNPDQVNRIPLVYEKTGGDGTRSVLPLCTNAAIDPMPPAPASPLDPVITLDTQLTSLVGCVVPKMPAGAACETTIPAPNPCLIGAPSVGTEPTVPPYRALFRNREIAFVLTDLDQYFGDTTQITFDVHGGYQAESVIVPTTIDVEMPTRIVLSPLDSQTQAVDQSATHELPYLFVVDQRRLGRASAGVGATRGQILRISPRRVTTSDTTSLLPIYDDLTATGSLWPIQ